MLWESVSPRGVRRYNAALILDPDLPRATRSRPSKTVSASHSNFIFKLANCSSSHLGIFICLNYLGHAFGEHLLILLFWIDVNMCMLRVP